MMTEWAGKPASMVPSLCCEAFMVAIKAHFDGNVFVPDEPVQFRPGEPVVVQPITGAQADQTPGSDVSFVRKLNIDLDARSLREIAEDPELNLENF